jgi:dolichyl-phosphate beta-glucosyltransferase
VPAYNEAQRLPTSLAALQDFLTAQSYTAEVIVVENGSVDDTAGVVMQLMDSLPDLRLIQLKQRGKGQAVRTGVLEACGEVIFLCDADLSMPLTEIPRFLQTLNDGYDIVVGSREGPGAIRYGEPQYRHIMGRVFNKLVQMLAVPNLEDTQCGFKAFAAAPAHELFRRQTLAGWAFDVEILYLARKLGYRVAELPIEWHFNHDTRVQPLQDTWSMVQEIVRVRLNDWRGVYKTECLVEIRE